jgi:hypothetical protein
VEAVVRLIVVVVLVLAACSAPQPPQTPPLTPPTWTRQFVPTLPYERLESVAGAAGWDGGFLLAGRRSKPAAPNNRGRVNDIVSAAYQSEDGETWREVEVPGQTGGRSCVGPVAGFGDRGYCTTDDPQGVLTFERDGVSLQQLPGGRSSDSVVSIAAGPRGVVVVAFLRPSGNRAAGLRIWHSADGKTFDAPVTWSDKPLGTVHVPHAVATDRGFLLANANGAGVTVDQRDVQLFESEDGRTWKPIGDQLPPPPTGHFRPAVTAAQHNNGVTVAFGTHHKSGDPAGENAGLTGWYRRDGETTWTELTDIDPGRLPDAGVVPRHQRRVYEVHRWQTGFLALGTADRSTALWTSADGVGWRRTPVRDNGFETSGRLRYLSGGGRSLMLRADSAGGMTELKGPTEMWRAG